MFDQSQAFSSFSVKDLDAAETFYGDVLGFEVERQPEGLALHVGGGTDVFLYPKDDHQPATFTVLNLPVDDIEATVDQLVAKGVTMQRYDQFDQDERGIVAEEPGTGPRIAWFEDPAGNVISVMKI